MNSIVRAVGFILVFSVVHKDCKVALSPEKSIKREHMSYKISTFNVLIKQFEYLNNICRKSKKKSFQENYLYEIKCWFLNVISIKFSNEYKCVKLKFA